MPYRGFEGPWNSKPVFLSDDFQSVLEQRGEYAMDSNAAQQTDKTSDA